MKEPMKQKGWYSRGYLPHRDIIGALQSITFRLADSLPQEKLLELEQVLAGLSPEEAAGERRTRIETWLDAGMGCCALGHPQMASVMQETLFIADGHRYRLLAWCIMPNHVHVLIDPIAPLWKIVQGWKSYTGRWAMQHATELGLSGLQSRFWMREYWDRYIRDEHHLESVVDYIHQNPLKAGLCIKAHDWLWSSASGQLLEFPIQSSGK